MPISSEHVFPDPQHRDHRPRSAVLLKAVEPDDQSMTFDDPRFVDMLSHCERDFSGECSYVGWIEEEIVWFRRSGIQRGCGGTKAKAHPAGTKVQIIGLAAPGENHGEK